MQEAWRINKNSDNWNQSVIIIKNKQNRREKKRQRERLLTATGVCRSRCYGNIFFPASVVKAPSLEEFRVVVDSSPDMQALYIPKILQC